MNRYLQNKFNPDANSSVGVTAKVTSYTSEQHDNQTYKVQIWDSSGQDRFHKTVSSYFRNADGVCVVFDLTDYQSYMDLRDWITDVRHANRDKEGMPFIIVGNKLDLCEANAHGNERQIDPEDAAQLAETYGIDFYETSAKSGENVREMLINLIEKSISYTVEEFYRKLAEIQADELMDGQGGDNPRHSASFKINSVNFSVD